jgi:hypothetical protein
MAIASMNRPPGSAKPSGPQGIVLVATMTALVAGWFLHQLYLETTPSKSMPSMSLPAQADAMPTTEHNLVITVINVDATGTATEIPTLTPTSATRVTINDCGSPEPGQICEVPYPPPPTMTPYPDCGTVLAEPTPRGGVWCKWKDI